MKKMQLGINDVTHFGDVSALIDPDVSFLRLYDVYVI